MTGYILRRLAYAIPIALSVTLVAFLLVHIVPGDPMNAIAPPDAPAELVASLRVTYGLDRPLPVQYGLWLKRALSGDLGTSLATGRSVASEVMACVKNTLILAGAAALIGVVLGCTLGALAGYWHRGAIDRIATGLSLVGVSVPHYWLGVGRSVIFL